MPSSKSVDLFSRELLALIALFAAGYAWMIVA